MPERARSPNLRSAAGSPGLCVGAAQICLLLSLPSPPCLSTGAQGLGGGGSAHRGAPVLSALAQGKGVMWGPFSAQLPRAGPALCSCPRGAEDPRVLSGASRLQTECPWGLVPMSPPPPICQRPGWMQPLGQSSFLEDAAPPLRVLRTVPCTVGIAVGRDLTRLTGRSAGKAVGVPGLEELGGWVPTGVDLLLGPGCAGVGVRGQTPERVLTSLWPRGSSPPMSSPCSLPPLVVLDKGHLHP